MRAVPAFLLSTLLLTWGPGCNGGDPPVDDDGDGALSTEDCDDGDAGVFPGALELCNNTDDDCDGTVDEGLSDSDGDGTCDDLDTETCDGLDNDGDGEIDDGFPDTDGDRIADCVDTEDCDGVDNDGDGAVDEDLADSDGDGTCDDLDSEACDGLDNDGDGRVDEDFLDNDGDGIADCVDSEDCDGLDNDGDGTVDEGSDISAGLSTLARLDTEECDGVDNDGDGAVDEDFPDTDGDGTADCLDSEDCDGLDNDGDGTTDEGFTDTDSDGTADCVDTEECDGADNDGDGTVDEGIADDADGDGYSICDGDCDDADSGANPGTAESQDGSDNDCDGLVDEDWIDTGDVIITEVHVDPDFVTDNYGEYFEVMNLTDAAVDLIGWTLRSGSESHTISKSLVVGPGKVTVLSTHTSSANNGGFTGRYRYDNDLSFDSTDDLSLNLGTLLVDSVDWTSGSWPWGTGAAMELDPSSGTETANDDPAAWCASALEITAGGDLGTPGVANAYCGHIDHDGDGVTGDDGDCDDDNPLAYPGSTHNEPGVDNDCDGSVENTPPTAVAELSNTGTILTCETVFLEGANSSDPDGDPILGYDWSLQSAPGGSILGTSDIEDVGDPSPMFVPDEEGTFTFGLVVTDGSDDSAMATVDVEVVSRGYNTAPVSDAGHDQSYSDTAACTATAYGYTCNDCSTVVFVLDGTGTIDADGDDLVYAWTTGSSYATLGNDDSDVASLTITGVPATYGTTTTETIDVDLEVRDCEGELSTDTVTITYECTGS